MKRKIKIILAITAIILVSIVFGILDMANEQKKAEKIKSSPSAIKKGSDEEDIPKSLSAPINKDSTKPVQIDQEIIGSLSSPAEKGAPVSVSQDIMNSLSAPAK